jgi:sarcosine oxidase
VFDAIVIGLGGMGSASLYQLARRGLTVLGLEQFSVPHAFGSSHGLTRIIRLAYFESPSYVPLVRRAYELWLELERNVDTRLFHRTGSVDAGWESSRTVQGSLEACREHGLPFELLDAASANRRWPGYQLDAGMVALFQPQGGFLTPEACVRAYVRRAIENGAQVHEQEQVVSWQPTPDGVEVRTAHATYRAARLVITTGPWARHLVPALQNLAVPERQVVMWTAVEDEALFEPDRFPVFNLQASHDLSERYYGYPTHGRPGFKIGKYHHRRERGEPDALRRDTNAEDEELLRVAIRRFFPQANGRTLATETCLFTNTPDEHFILDRHPDAGHVAIAAGFSGHGFKFCSVVGEIMADLVTEGGSNFDLTMFGAGRFASRHAN